MSLSQKLPPDWIDLAHGEAKWVEEDALLKHFRLPTIVFRGDSYDCLGQHINTTTTGDTLSYQHPAGYEPLRKCLAQKHNVEPEQIIVCNGAKQGLAAIFNALVREGRKILGSRVPTWSLIRPLAEMSGLRCREKFPSVDAKYDALCDTYLCISPNNPDGFIHTKDDLDKIREQHKDIPIIHDAAYNTPVYMPLDDGSDCKALGDMQVFSISKMFGLSSLRLGYIIFNTTEQWLRRYNAVRDYIEATTVGVSIPSQIMLLELLKEMQNFPSKERAFIVDARQALFEAKFMLRMLRPGILSLPDNVENIPGMFVWAKCLDPEAFEKAKLLVSCGAGSAECEDHIRINMAAGKSAIRKAIERLNG